ncbi:Outer membrane protein TolC [Trichlorobacter thiogenes]|uniref:Outer membrane protein TolC n=1 Tax=Trichlorobacter thiogenes TaxID=115783 RepID=A0A1T4RLA2_9BACT|nr:TolC family protein [Trichlorobacter thiogenes]SKA16677.1 Outer membrane protein TolC [Trichlorobacter thiogenes]
MTARILIVFTTILLLSQQALAAPQLLTLEDCLKIAADKNLDIQKAKEYANYVQGRYVEERAAALPQLGLQAGFGYSKDDSTKALYGAAQMQANRTVDLSLSQPLYTWGKIGAALRAAEVGLKTADQQLRLFRQAAFRDVSIAFYDVLLAKELHRLAQENLAQKERHHTEAKRKFEAGVATDYDLLAAEVELQNARPELIRTENSIRTSRERLRFLLGADQAELDVTGMIEAKPEQVSGFDESLKIALDKRPELANQKLQIGINQELITIANADDKPRLDLKGTAGWHQLEVSNPGPVRQSDGPAWNAGVYLTFPFFDGMRSRGKTQQARSDLRTSQLQEQKLRDSITLELRTARYNLAESAETINALSGTVKQAERLLQMAEKGFEYGVKTRLEVDDAQTNLLRAQSNLARANRDYLAASVNLRWAMGVAGE